MDEEFAALFLPELPSLRSTSNSPNGPQDDNGPLDESQAMRIQRRSSVLAASQPTVQNQGQSNKPNHANQSIHPFHPSIAHVQDFADQLALNMPRRYSELSPANDGWNYPQDYYGIQRQIPPSHYSNLIPAEASRARTSEAQQQESNSPAYRGHQQPSPSLFPMPGFAPIGVQPFSPAPPTPGAAQLTDTKLLNELYALGMGISPGIPSPQSFFAPATQSPRQYSTGMTPLLSEVSDHSSETPQNQPPKKPRKEQERSDSLGGRADGLDLLKFSKLPADRPFTLLDKQGNPVEMTFNGHILGRFFWNAKNWDLVDPAVGLSTCPIACYRRNSILIWCLINFSGTVHSVRLEKTKTEEERVVELDTMRFTLHASSSVSPRDSVEVNILTDRSRKASVGKDEDDANAEDSPESNVADEIKMHTHTVETDFHKGPRAFVVRKAQFRKATPNNSKLAARSFYYMLLTLVGVDRHTKQPVHLFTMTTNPITVRGRNPSFYTEYNDILITKDLVHHLKMEVPLMLQHLKDQNNETANNKRKADDSVPVVHEEPAQKQAKPMSRSADIVTKSRQYQYFPISSAYYLPPVQVYYFPHSSAHNERKPTSLPIFKRSTSQTQPVSAASLLNTIGNGRLPRKSFKSQGYFSSSEGRQRVPNMGRVDEDAIAEDEPESSPPSEIRSYSGSQSITYKYFLKPETTT
ncbi:unnamed protein product [Kuraishia capsulata CBS 1993]|uniref:NDT80 domain-containing protein n=1 Tax=Kuraishia capsulata CBS 1993 TaxID=1382522 RepID=W6MR21_9ASCO|nr:uncharacterized protein KUCA_T00005138001 [Kuraishia capsulata CBS 1993]CDK29151.1 unnamed protein product [Kuraishia capsulata CBS 1993]